MGSSHAGSAGDGIGGVARVVGRVGGHARSIDVDARSGVREVGDLVENVGRADGDDVAVRSTKGTWGVVASI